MDLNEQPYWSGYMFPFSIFQVFLCGVQGVSDFTPECCSYLKKSHESFPTVSSNVTLGSYGQQLLIFPLYIRIHQESLHTLGPLRASDTAWVDT